LIPPLAQTTWVPTESAYERIRLEVRKGPFLFSAEGDLFFVPPDTLRMEIQSEWGEVLFNLRMAGDQISVMPDNGFDPQGVLEKLPSKRALFSLLTGRPGLDAFDPSDSMQFRSVGSGIEAEGRNLICEIDTGNGRIKSFRSKPAGLLVSELLYEASEHGALVSHFRIEVSGRGALDFQVLSRKSAPQYNGQAVLK